MHLVPSPGGDEKTLGTSVSLGLTRKQPLIVLTQPLPDIPQLRNTGPEKTRPNPVHISSSHRAVNAFASGIVTIKQA